MAINEIICLPVFVLTRKQTENKGLMSEFKTFGKTLCYYRFHSDSISVLLCVIANFSFLFIANSEPLQWHRMTA